MPGLAKTVYDLDVFKEAYQLALDIHEVSHSFPKTEQYGGIADQVRRASKGVCANLSEGFGKNSSTAEFRRFIWMALGSNNEVELWLHFARDLNMVASDVYEGLLSRNQKTSRMLRGLWDKTGRT